MKILILNWRDPKHHLAGGAEQMVFEHAKYWKRKGAEVVWFASSFRNAKNEETLDGIKIIRKGNHYTVFIWTFIFYLRNKFRDTTLVVDCFHFIPYFSVFYIKHIPKIVIVQEVAGRLWFDNIFPPFALLGYMFEPWILRFYKKNSFITGSESAKRDLIKTGIHNDRIFVISHGINRVRMRRIAKEKKPVLIFLGRVSKDKGIEDALKVIRKLKDEGINIKLWIVGKSETDEYEQKVLNLIEEYGIGKECRWFGYVTQKEKYILLSKAWIIIHPSKKEGWGLNVIEANSVGTPAVGFAVGGLTDSIIDNQTGILVKPDIDGMVIGIKKALSDRAFRDRLGVHARVWSKKFTWEQASKKSWELIVSITKVK